MPGGELEEELLRSVALQNAHSILLARQRAEQSLLHSREELRISEAKLKLAIAVAGLGLVTVDYTTSMVVLDDEAAAMFDLPANQSVPRSDLHARFHPDDAAEIERRIAAALTPGNVDYITIEIRITRSDGEVRWISARKQVEFGPDKNGDARPLRGLLVVRDVTQAKLGEARLASSEARYRSVVEGSLQGIVIQQGGRIVYANPAMARLFGYATPQDMVGLRTLEDLVEPDDWAVLRARTEAAYGGKRVEPHPGWRGLHKTGRKMWVSSTAHISDWQGKPAVTSFYSDITEEKLAQERLRESELAYRQALKAAQSGAFGWDIVNDRVTWSEEIGELLKVKPEDFPKNLAEFLNFIPDEDRELMVDGIKARIAGPSNDYDIENRLLRSDGTILRVRGRGRIERDDRGAPVMLVGLVSDIEELHKARSLLSESETRLRRILDTVAALVVTLSPQGVVTDANALAFTIAGAARDDVVGRFLWDCPWWNYSPDVQQELEHAIKRAASGGAVRHDVAIRDARGQFITIDFQLVPNFDGHGRVVELVASGVDITERKRGEAHIRLLMREVSHRSKNLLSVVQAIARHSARDAGAMSFVARFSERVMALSANQDLLVKSEWQGVDMQELAEAQLAHFKDLFGTRVLVAGDSLRLTPAAAQGIGMALHELTTNAAKYGALSNDSGKVNIAWRLANSTEPAIEIAWEETGGPRVVAPTDKGFGQLVIGPMVEAAVNGTVEIDYRQEGLWWKLCAPAEGTTELTGQQLQSVNP